MTSKINPTSNKPVVEQPGDVEIIDLRKCDLAKADPISKLYWQNNVGGSIYIGAQPPISNGADIRMITIGRDYFMYCSCCEKETLMRYNSGKTKKSRKRLTNILGPLTLCITTKLIEKFCLKRHGEWLESGAAFQCLRCESKGTCSNRPAADVIAEQDPADTENRFSYFFTIDHQLWSDAKMERIKKSRYGADGDQLGDNEKILIAHNHKKDALYLAGEGV